MYVLFAITSICRIRIISEIILHGLSSDLKYFKQPKHNINIRQIKMSESSNDGQLSSMFSSMFSAATPLREAVAGTANRFMKKDLASSLGSVTKSPTAPDEKDEKSPEDIPKEDLMHLCMKLSKRMQSMESKMQEVSKGKKNALNDRRFLLDLIKTLVTLPPSASDDSIDLDIASIRESWLVSEEKRTSKIFELETKIRSMAQEHSAEINSTEQRYRKELVDLQSKFIPTDGNNDKLSVAGSGESLLIQELERYSSEKQELQKEVNALQSRCISLEKEYEQVKESVEDLTARLLNAQSGIAERDEKLAAAAKSSEYTVATLEEKVVFLQIQMQKMKTQEDNRERELSAIRRQLENAGMQMSSLQLQLEEKEASLRVNKETIVHLQFKIDEVEPELDKFRDRARDVERNMGAAAVLKAEQEALLVSLRKDLKSALDSKDEITKQLNELLNDKALKKAVAEKAAEYEKRLNEMQIVLDENNSLITRLRAENQTSERNHAMRTAMLATCEAQLQSSQMELAAKDELIHENGNHVAVLQARIKNFEEKLNLQIREHQENVQELQKISLDTDSRHKSEIQKIKVDNDAAIESIKKEYTKKIGTARALLTEREEEVRTLGIKVQEQQAEIASGAPNERRIFELAQVLPDYYQCFF